MLKPPVLPKPGIDGGFKATTVASGTPLAANPKVWPTIALIDVA